MVLRETVDQVDIRTQEMLHIRHFLHQKFAVMQDEFQVERGKRPAGSARTGRLAVLRQCLLPKSEVGLIDQFQQGLGFLHFTFFNIGKNRIAFQLADRQ